MKLIYHNALSICFLILAGFLAYHNKDGWGWCVFGAIVNGVSIRTKRGE
jgi:hypothetical protein